MKLYKWESFNETIKTDIESICKKYNIKNYTIDNGLVNVEGNVSLSVWMLDKLPLRFGKVSGDFYCHNNKLTTIEGSPEIITWFDCSNNRLTSLKGSPKKVVEVFDCSANRLTTLLGGPEDVGYYRCHYNHLTDVRGFPEYYRGKIFIFENPVYEIIKLFRLDTDIVIETLNDYNVIRPGKKVNLQLLKYAFDELEIVMPEIEYIEGYEII